MEPQGTIIDTKTFVETIQAHLDSLGLAAESIIATVIAEPSYEHEEVILLNLRQGAVSKTGEISRAPYFDMEIVAIKRTITKQWVKAKLLEPATAKTRAVSIIMTVLVVGNNPTSTPTDLGTSIADQLVADRHPTLKDVLEALAEIEGMGDVATLRKALLRRKALLESQA